MEIRTFKETDLPELHRFCEIVYPKRVKYYHELLDFFLKNKIGGYTGGIGLFDDNGTLCGQQLYSSISFWFKGVEYKGGWCFDLIVREDLRKEAWGMDLIIQSMKIFPYACGTGAGPLSKSISLKLGMKSLGNIKKYVGIASKPSLLFNLLLPLRSFPQKVGNYSRIVQPEDFTSKEYFNRNIIEPGRNKEYIAWRFFTPSFKKYFVYQNSVGSYFVVRRITIKGVSILALVDFRCNVENPDEFKDIVRCIKQIANHIHVGFLLVGSSHKTFDSILEKSGLKPIGRDRPILTAGKNKVTPDKERVEKRGYVFVTLADSDGEVSW